MVRRRERPAALKEGNLPVPSTAPSRSQPASQASAAPSQHTWIANIIWGIADDVLRDVYVRGKYRELYRQFTDNESLRKWLTDTVFARTYRVAE